MTGLVFPSFSMRANDISHETSGLQNKRSKWPFCLTPQIGTQFSGNRLTQIGSLPAKPVPGRPAMWAVQATHGKHQCGFDGRRCRSKTLQSPLLVPIAPLACIGIVLLVQRARLMLSRPATWFVHGCCSACSIRCWPRSWVIFTAP